MTLRSEFLMDLAAEVGEAVSMGKTPLGERRVVAINGGTFEGPEMRGQILAGGADWQLARTDGVLELDAQYVLQEQGGGIVARGKSGIPSWTRRGSRGVGTWRAGGPCSILLSHRHAVRDGCAVPGVAQQDAGRGHRRASGEAHTTWRVQATLRPRAMRWSRAARTYRRSSWTDQPAAAKALSSTASASSISLADTISGGVSRITLP
jgi:hypothetical protein